MKEVALTDTVPDRINVLWFLPTHGDSRYLGTSIVAATSTSTISSRWRKPLTSLAISAC